MCLYLFLCLLQSLQVAEELQIKSAKLVEVEDELARRKNEIGQLETKVAGLVSDHDRENTNVQITNLDQVTELKETNFHGLLCSFSVQQMDLCENEGRRDKQQESIDGN